MARYAILTYDDSFYLPENIRKQYKDDPGMVRKEYTRLRDIAQKRLKRMASSEWGTSQIYRRNVDAFPKLKDIKSGTHLSYVLADLSRFVSSPQSTLSGLRARRTKAIDTLHEHGFDFVTPENFKKFGEFMEYWRDEKLDSIYDSGDAADAYYIVEKHGIKADAVQKDFEFWLQRENIDIAAKLKPSKGMSKGSARRLRDRIQKQKKRKGRRSRK